VENNRTRPFAILTFARRIAALGVSYEDSKTTRHQAALARRLRCRIARAGSDGERACTSSSEAISTEPDDYGSEALYHSRYDRAGYLVLGSDRFGVPVPLTESAELSDIVCSNGQCANGLLRRDGFKQPA
jgi:hypothetical protein